MATIYDIAKKSGFAPATVSKALNNYNGVNEASKKKIIAVAKEMGYHPNTAARSLRTSKSYSIGVIFALDGRVGANQLLLMNILNSFQEVIQKEGYDLILLTKTKSKDGTYSYLSHIEKRRVDGILIFGNYYKEEVKELLMLSSIPKVGFDYIGTKICGVTSDSYEKYFELTKKLIELGHRNIVFLHGEKNIVTDERIRGFKDALSKNSIPFNDNMIVETGYYNVNANHEATLKILKQSNPPTAILYPDDYSSLGGLAAIDEMDLNVPNDISVAGFDGTDIGRSIHPSLTTVKQNTDLLGKQLAQELIDQIDNKGHDKTKSIKVIQSELIFTPSISKPNH